MHLLCLKDRDLFLNVNPFPALGIDKQGNLVIFNCVEENFPFGPRSEKMKRVPEGGLPSFLNLNPKTNLKSLSGNSKNYHEDTKKTKSRNPNHFSYKNLKNFVLLNIPACQSKAVGRLCFRAIGTSWRDESGVLGQSLKKRR